MKNKKPKMNKKQREKYISLQSLAVLFKELAKREIEKKKRKEVRK